jgi:hypothetical protein
MDISILSKNRKDVVIIRFFIPNKTFVVFFATDMILRIRIFVAYETYTSIHTNISFFRDGYFCRQLLPFYNRWQYGLVSE